MDLKQFGEQKIIIKIKIFVKNHKQILNLIHLEKKMKKRIYF